MDGGTMFIGMMILLAVIVLAIVWRDKSPSIHATKSGIEIHTNDVAEYSRIVDTIDGIDSGTEKAVRKATDTLTILDPEKYKMHTDVLLVIEKANKSLIYAAYENHHTRELHAGADAYLADKKNDVYIAVRFWKKHFPELTAQRCDAHVCHWFKDILLPNQRRACVEKVTFYQEQMKDKNVSKNIKTIIAGCLKKNEQYIADIDVLDERPDIVEKSSIFYSVP
jgi:hypothetical protein